MANVTLVLCENPVDGLPDGVQCICKATSIPPPAGSKLPPAVCPTCRQVISPSAAE